MYVYSINYSALNLPTLYTYMLFLWSTPLLSTYITVFYIKSNVSIFFFYFLDIKSLSYIQSSLLKLNQWNLSNSMVYRIRLKLDKVKIKLSTQGRGLLSFYESIVGVAARGTPSMGSQGRSPIRPSTHRW